MIAKEITLRPYQSRTVPILVCSPRVVVQAPAGSGKTLIGAAALAEWLSNDHLSAMRIKVVIIANTREQVEQWQKAVAHFPTIELRCELVIACYAAKPDCTRALLVILDECQHIASPENRKVLDGFHGWRWGFSATPFRADDLRRDVFELIGTIGATIERGELLAEGHLAHARVLFHEPNTRSEMEREITARAEPLIAQRKRFWTVPEDEIRKRTIWTICQELGIFKNRRRNAEIIRLANGREETDSALIIVGSIEHGEAISMCVPGAAVAHSKMGAKKRRDTMDAFRDGTLTCLIATSLADEGLDVPRANMLILAAGGRSAAKAEQRTGRVLRSWGEKTHGTIHDFHDHQFYFLLAQSRARAKTYESLGYEVVYASSPYV